MGATACRAITADDALELVAAVDPSAAAEIVGGVTVAADVAAFAAADCQVVVDFTTAGAARENVPVLLRQGIHEIVGTTGLTDGDLDVFAAAAASGGGNVLVATNFSISAVLLMRLSELVAPFFDTAEIIELHHDGKVDAPRARRSPRRSALLRRRATGPRIRRRKRRSPGRAAPRDRPESASTPCACAAWSPTRRSSSAPVARR